MVLGRGKHSLESKGRRHGHAESKMEFNISGKQDRVRGDHYYLELLPCYTFVFMALSIADSEPFLQTNDSKFVCVEYFMQFL